MLLRCGCAGEGKQMTLRMMIGCAVAIAGFCLYSHARMAAKPAGPPNGDPEAAAEKEVSQHHLHVASVDLETYHSSLLARFIAHCCNMLHPVHLLDSVVELTLLSRLMIYIPVHLLGSSTVKACVYEQYSVSVVQCLHSNIVALFSSISWQHRLPSPGNSS